MYYMYDKLVHIVFRDQIIFILSRRLVDSKKQICSVTATRV